MLVAEGSPNVVRIPGRICLDAFSNPFVNICPYVTSNKEKSLIHLNVRPEYSSSLVLPVRCVHCDCT